MWVFDKYELSRMKQLGLLFCELSKQRLRELEWPVGECIMCKPGPSDSKRSALSIESAPRKSSIVFLV